MSALAPQTRPVAFEIHALLRDLDPARWRSDAQDALLRRKEELTRKLQELSAALAAEGSFERLQLLVDEMASMLDYQIAQVSAAAAESRAEWEGLRLRLQPTYEAFAQSLRRLDIHVPSLRPTNYRRNVLHAAGGFVAAALLLLIPSAGVLIAIAAAWFVSAWSLEIARRQSPAFNKRVMRVFAPVAHPHEAHRVNSSTWYCTALLLLSLTGSLTVCVVAVLVLGVGDPAAAIVGRRFGKTKLLNGRSLEGTATFVVVAGGVAFAALTLLLSLPVVTAAAIAGAGAVCGALAELLSRRVDDNLTIPVAAGFATWVVAALMAVPQGF